MRSTRRRPLLIATLPGRNVAEVRRDTVRAAEQGADAAEVRFDRWEDRQPAELAQLFPTPVPLVATLRSTSEGGAGPDGPAERRAWREAVEALPFGWIDLEMERDPVPAGPPGPRPIWSRHFRGDDALRELEARLETPSPPGGMLKLVAPATVREVIDTLLPGILAHPAKGERCIMTTGPSGPLLRLWAPELGASAVYCSLESFGGADPVEPAQVPVGRYSRWLGADPVGPLFSVVGSPIGHSLSPALHDLWMREEGRAGLYVALDISEPTELSDVLPGLARRGFRGLNVTHPLKDAAFSVATRRSAAAEEVGGANTLTLDAGEVVAHNTDVSAVRSRMTELSASYPGILRQVLVVGTGGAARAALAAARELAVRPEVLARDAARSQQLAGRYNAEVAPHPAPGAATLVIHATTVGRAGSPSLEVPIEEWIDSRTYVLDFVYSPDHPTLADLARRHGARYEDGRRLLAYAAAASYSTWWGAPPSASLIEQALRELP